MVRVMIVDDHKMVQEGLRMILEASGTIEVVRMVCDGDQAVDAVAASNPDVVLMDLSMPGMDGVEATRRIVADHDDVRVVVLTSIAERSHVIAAVDAGAVGFLLKDSEPEVVVEAVLAAVRGESPLHPRAAAALVRDRHASSSSGVRLSNREREVLCLVAEGLANKQIARRLGIAERTVKAHLTRVFAELEVADRLQAALWVRQNGLASVA